MSRLWQKACANGEAHQVRDIVQPQFSHHIRAVRLHRLDADDLDPFS
ncbi:MAG TPA: hypothetical protein VJ761_24285 [Ktedonobacteraceae bacterium]|nr:hypothetical protein [Ktedonobacteraceae bacterium]